MTLFPYTTLFRSSLLFKSFLLRAIPPLQAIPLLQVLLRASAGGASPCVLAPLRAPPILPFIQLKELFATVQAIPLINDNNTWTSRQFLLPNRRCLLLLPSSNPNRNLLTLRFESDTKCNLWSWGLNPNPNRNWYSKLTGLVVGTKQCCGPRTIPALSSCLKLSLGGINKSFLLWVFPQSSICL